MREVIKYYVEFNAVTRLWEVKDEKKYVVAFTKEETHAQRLADSLWFTRRMVEEFPGLFDGDTDVDGADLVDWVSLQMNEMDYLKGLVAKDAKRALRRIDA